MVPQSGGGVLDQLVALDAESLPTGLCVTNTGRYVLAGEGGTISVLDTTAPNGMQNPVDHFLLSSRGIVPVAMMLDPDANLENATSDPYDLVYVAAGRDGLWLVSIDDSWNGGHFARRVDDSGDQDKATQGGRRWRQDVDVVTIGGKRYLATIGAKLDANFLRLFELDAVRAVAAWPSETGGELAPKTQIRIPGRTPRSDPDHAPCYAYGMAVDQSPADNAAGADVYVALGEDGLARVRITPGANPAVDPPVLALSYGPYFGDASPAAGGAPPADRLYDDVRFYDYTEMQAAVLDAQRAPLFLDVAVQPETSGQHRLFCAVDTCGLVGFDLSAGWSDQLLPLDSPGTVLTVAPGSLERGTGADASERMVQLDPAAGKNWMRRVAYAQLGSRKVVAAASYARALEVWPQQRNEGRRLNGIGDRHSGVRKFFEPLGSGALGFTVVYDVSSAAWPPALERSITLGGQELEIPAGQSGTGTLTVFGSGGGEGVIGLSFGLDPENLQGLAPMQENHRTFRWDIDLSDPAGDVLIERRPADRRGRFCYVVGASASDERVWLTGSNDAGVHHDGPLWTCGGAVHHDPQSTGNDAQLHGGIFWNPKAQWSNGADAYYWSLGSAKWRMQKYSVGSGLCTGSEVPPAEVKRIFISSPPDRFNYIGRGFLSAGSLDAAYDAYVQQNVPGLETAEIVFGSRMGTDWGIVVMRRDVLQGKLDDSSVPDGQLVDPKSTGAVMGTLVTHPEYANVPSFDQEPNNEKFIKSHGLEGHTLTYSPAFTQLTDGNGAAHHVLAVPCGAVAAADADLGNYTVPQAFQGWKDYPLIRLFEVNISSPDDFGDGSPNIPAWSIIGPRIAGESDGAAVLIETAEFSNKTWMFVTDFAGALLVYDITNLLVDHSGGADLDPNSFPPVVHYVPPADFTDAFPSNVWGIALDQVSSNRRYVYLGVSRVGVVVLEFLPDAQGGPQVQFIEIIQTPGEAMGLWIRTDPDSGDHQLMVANTYAGIRVFGPGN